MKFNTLFLLFLLTATSFTHLEAKRNFFEKIYDSVATWFAFEWQDEEETTAVHGRHLLKGPIKSDITVHGKCLIQSAKGPFNTTVHGTIIKKSYELACNNLSVHGTVEDITTVTAENIHIYGAFTGKAIIVHDFMMVSDLCTLANSSLGTLQVRNNCVLTETRAAHLIMKNKKKNKVNDKSITLIGSSTYVETVTFENETGTLYLKDGARVGTVTNGIIIKDTPSKTDVKRIRK